MLEELEALEQNVSKSPKDDSDTEWGAYSY
jgi:hypothetical protein